MSGGYLVEVLPQGPYHDIISPVGFAQATLLGIMKLEWAKDAPRTGA